MAHYKQLLAHIEDMEDALLLKTAIKADRGQGISFGKWEEKLRKQGTSMLLADRELLKVL